MSRNPSGETREQREELTRVALAEVLRRRITIARPRLYQTVLATKSGISRTHLRTLLHAEQNTSLLIFLEMSDAFEADACELLREVLSQRDALRDRRFSVPKLD